MSRVKDKVAIVTGAATGIGRAIAEFLVAEGADVVITDINNELGEKAVREMAGDTIFLPHNVANEESWRSVVEQTVVHFGRVDILVNNAGIGSPNTRPQDADLDTWHRVQQVNLDGPFLGCKYIIPVMEKCGGGSIINISSVASVVPTAGDLAYGASKAAVWQLTRSLAFDCAKNGSGIRVNSIHPGAILTDGIKERRSEDVLQQVSNGIPLGHMGDPEDIAFGVLFLASDESKYITGHAMAVDGGFLLSPSPAPAPQ